MPLLGPHDFQTMSCICPREHAWQFAAPPKAFDTIITPLVNIWSMQLPPSTLNRQRWARQSLDKIFPYSWTTFTPLRNHNLDEITTLTICVYIYIYIGIYGNYIHIYICICRMVNSCSTSFHPQLSRGPRQKQKQTRGETMFSTT